jgi:hypothetical protein
LLGFDESMSSSSCVSWLERELNRAAEPADLYECGKELYQRGLYVGASKLLQLYVSGSGSELPGSHLLAYACMMIDDKRRAVEHARKVVNCQFNTKESTHTPKEHR